MAEERKYDRCQFIGTTALAIAAAQFGMIPSIAESNKVNTVMINRQAHLPTRSLRLMVIDGRLAWARPGKL